MWQWLISYACARGARALQGWDMEGKAKPMGILPSSNLQKTGTRTTLIDNFLCSPITRPLVVSCLNAQQGWLKLGIRKSNLTCRLARNWTDNLSSLQDLPQWSSVRTSLMSSHGGHVGILSPVSELVWALEVLSSPVLTSLSVDFTEKNKRVISDFSVQQLQLKQQWKKKLQNFSFLSPTFMSHSWGVPSPQSKPF